ncbi:YegP family protein [Flavobacterium paronense]|uniref:YegP family protein n=1 Tax=Flavobacterium paronense TaxID=1392775 RepID=A0ABV5GDY0_9FLAO|nr:YegP family protein [Flavobacterium paronense]MDN3676281.1 YegP family protein [Flavobacterium paronense]
MEKFVITKRTNGDFQFTLKATNGERILTSEGYATKAGCENGIDSVRTNVLNVARYERKVAVNGNYYFNLRAANGEIIGTSELYESTAGRDNGIEAVKNNTPQATVEDLS